MMLATGDSEPAKQFIYNHGMYQKLSSCLQAVEHTEPTCVCSSALTEMALRCAARTIRS